MSPPPIALLTDYGHLDAYAGVLRAVIFSICPDARFLDLSHEVPSQNVLTAAYLIASAAPFLPRGSIVLGVVDPGVGSPRREVAIRTERLLLIGPDNGLFSLHVRDDPIQRVVELDVPRFHQQPVSPTFHGRDIFAPVAAHLANDVPFDRIGTAIEADSLVSLPVPEPVVAETTIECHILHVDGFGNAITDLTAVQLDDWARDRTTDVIVCSSSLPLRRTFSEVEDGQALAYIGSTGRLEIAVRNGHAAEQLALSQGDKVVVRKL